MLSKLILKQTLKDLPLTVSAKQATLKFLQNQKNMSIISLEQEQSKK